MMKYGYILFLIALGQALLAQKHDNYWVIGSGYDIEAGRIMGSDLKFRDDQPMLPVFVPRDYTVDHSIATICDAEGRFHFASNICNIYNSNHQPVPGGDQLFEHPLKTSFCQPGGGSFGYRGFQMSFFLPHPAHDQQFFFFYMAMDTADRQDFTTHLFFALLDAETNSLLLKDQLLIESKMTTGMMTVVRHADGKSWWVLIPEHSSNTYFSLLLDEKGNFHGPYTQTIGIINHPRVWTGSAAISPDGTWYARVDEANGIQLMRFDRCTGLLSNYKHLNVPRESNGDLGLAFSQESRFIYCSTPFQVFQLDLLSDTLSEQQIIKIADLELHPENPSFPTTFTKMQLAPDGKIYITSWSSTYLHIIHDPDQAGTACNLQQHALKMRSFLVSSIPYMPNYRLGPISCEQACCGDTDGPGGTFFVTPNPGMGLYRISRAEAQMDRFRLFDASGKLLLDRRFVPCLESELDIRHLPPGLYPLHIHGPDTFHTIKLLKI